MDMALSAEYSFLALGCDGAFANEKLIAYIMNITEELEGRKICGGFHFVSATLCGNHRVNLVEASAFCYVDDTLHGDLFCTTLFLASSGMFLRICLVAKILASKAELRRSPASSCASEDFKVGFAQVLLDAKVSELEHARLMPIAISAQRHSVEAQLFHEVPCEIDCRDWYRRAKAGEAVMDICKSADPRLGKAVVQYAGLVVSLITCFNAGWTSIRWVHHCERPDCCKGIAGAFDPDQMQTQMVQIVMKLLLSSLPSTPEKGKWTKTWPCVTWFLRALCPHGMLRELLAIAGLKQVAAPQHAAPASDATKSGLDIDFAAIRGMRRDHAVAFVNKPETQHNIILLGVLLEPLRYLCAWSLKASSARHGAKRRFPAAMDLASPVSSPVAAMLRYYAALLRGLSSRCVLIWGFCHETFVAWSMDHPQRHSAVRRAHLGLLSWLSMRFNYWKLWPPKLLQTADSRLCDAVHTNVGRQFVRSCPRCLDQGCARRLRRKVRTEADLRERARQRAMMVWGHQIPVSIGDVEHTHSSNNVIGGQQQPTAGGFACRAFLKDCRLLRKSFSEWQTASTATGSQQIAPAARPSSLLDSLTGCKRALSPVDVFRKSKAVAGTLRGKLGSESNAAVTAEFLQLPVDRRQEYEELAVRTREIARRNRARHVFASGAGAELALPDTTRPSALLDDPRGDEGPCQQPGPSSMNHQAVGDVWLALARH